ncbi:Fungal transcriptional regulatory protein [Purpureocillium lavendulum]|uniref:Fungal transcriptional regulatory protein n=1 Tax=Purpureocillium lavendulum TaxID=1247861 RepID=A0AB34FYP2_9HYPO|nr:Fungal transcriptional regulatory protein [Purpureocillium lavendulum]
MLLPCEQAPTINMSDAEATPTKANAWTDEAKVELLLRIVAQLREDGKNVNWSRVNMPGRTIKSMQNQWTKFNKEIAELKNDDGSGVKTATPTRAKAARGRGRPKKSESVVAPGATDDEEDVKVTPKKRGAGRAASNSAAKRIKKDAEDALDAKLEEEDGDDVIKKAESDAEESVGF